MHIYTTFDDTGDHMMIATHDSLAIGAVITVGHRGVRCDARVIGCAPVDREDHKLTYSLEPV